MKTISLLALATLCLAGLAQGQSQFTVSPDQLIPDGSLTGMTSSFTVSGDTSLISSLTVGLDVNGTFNGDLYVSLTHDGITSILLNRPGKSASNSLGYGDPGLNVVFSDTAPNGNIHFYENETGPLTSQLTGLWAPDGRAVNPLDVNGTETPTEMLSAFQGVDPNGQWTLFAADVSAGDLNTLQNWSVNLSLVPEPSALMNGSLLAGFGWMAWQRRRR